MQKLDIGNSDFKDIRLNQRYLIDKSMLIRDVIDGSKVTLLPRPRRFGKILNMTMLRYFFEKTEESNAELFDGLKIADDAEAMQHQGKYPVIYLSLKDIKGEDWDEAYEHIKGKIANLYKSYSHIASSLAPDDKEIFNSIALRRANNANCGASLGSLTCMLITKLR